MGKQSRGQCGFCAHETTKGSMRRHLATCPTRRDQIASTGGKPAQLLHLRVQDAYDSAYWLDVEVRGTATLADVDSYLRAIWLECCGHLSRFSVGGWSSDDVPQKRRVGDAFADGGPLVHTYDFGTESVTQITPIESRNGAPLSQRPIVLMARNLTPQASCVECDQPASHLCSDCQREWESPGTLCAQHAKGHHHGEWEEEPIEVVNSPRLGRCGYTGPADPPY
jgi:hypothetical protein